MKTLFVRRITIARANSYIAAHHRHHKRVRGGIFALAVFTSDGHIAGVAIVGQPVARGCNHELVAEVTRLATDGTKNACSSLYGAAASVCTAMGYLEIQTYILASEPGTSLKAAGWSMVATVRGRAWNHRGDAVRRQDQPKVDKQRWSRVLRHPFPFEALEARL